VHYMRLESFGVEKPGLYRLAGFSAIVSKRCTYSMNSRRDVVIGARHGQKLLAPLHFRTQAGSAG